MNFFNKNKVGIEFHDQWIQVVELRLQGKQVFLEAFNRIVVPDGVIENGEIKDKIGLQTVLKDALDTANPRAIAKKQIAVSLPSRATFIHIFQLPLKLSPKDVRQAIGYEAENILPFKLEDLYWDYRVLSKEDPKKDHATQYILFAGIQKNIADEYADLFESIGLETELFGTPVDALLHVLNPHLGETENSAAIAFGPLSTQTLFFTGKHLMGVFSSNDGYEKFLKKMQAEHQGSEEEFREKWENNRLDTEELDELIQFIKRHYTQAQTLFLETFNAAPAKLFLTGEYASLPIFYNLARSSFPESKVLIGDPKRNLVVEDKKFFLKHREKGGKIPLSIYLTNPIGIALASLKRKMEKPINLLPSRIKSDIQRKNLELLGNISAVMMTVVSLLVGGTLFVKHQDLSFERTQLENQREAIENTLHGTRYQEIKSLFTSFNGELGQLSKIEAGFFDLSTFIEDLYALPPEGIQITRFTLDDADLTVQLDGIAARREDLLEFQQILESTEIIKKVDLPLSHFDQKTNISFSVDLELNFSQLPTYGSNPAQ